MSLVFLFLFFFFFPITLTSSTEVDILLQIKASLDPENRFLTSWKKGGDPCSAASFDGVACNTAGNVANISLQGMGLTGSIPAAVGGLGSLTGLYLHFNALRGEIPKEISSLTKLSDLYLNVNDLSGEIPPEISSMNNLQVLQLCYNKLSGSIPTQFGSLKKISVLALQYNHLTGAIPASLGDLNTLTRLDLSFNLLFGPVPLKLANSLMLQVLDIRNNSLSGAVPTGLKRLKSRFQYENNRGLCGVGFSGLKSCTVSDMNGPYQPEPFKSNGLPTDVKPESANLHQNNCSSTQCSKANKTLHVGVIFCIIGLVAAITVSGIFTLSWYRRQKQKIGSSHDTCDGRLSTDQVREVSRRKASPLINLEYANGWDPLARGNNGNNGFSQEVFESSMLNLEDIERATGCFSEANLLGKSNFSAVYKGMLRDGSIVAVKCIARTSCKSDDSEFFTGLKTLTLLKHENLVRLRGFCCSKGRGECFLVYDFVPNGTLLQYFDIEGGRGEILPWSTRVSIINGIANGITYLHGQSGKKSAIHQNISAEKVLIDHWYNASLADSGLQKLLTDDIVFSKLKASAAMGYLAPEYINTGKFTEKSDVYAFGMIVLQMLCGKSKIAHLTLQAIESGSMESLIDPNLEGKFPEAEAIKLGRIGLMCTNESPNQRPAIETVMKELSTLSTGSF